jgi:hypothetical protein
MSTRMPRLNVLGWIMVIALVLALLWAAVMTWKLKSAQAAAEKNALATTNALAAADHSRAVAIAARDSVRIFGDSLHAAERLIRQPAKSIAPDAIDRATGRSSIFHGAITVAPGNISTTATAVSSGTDSVRSAKFHVDSSTSKTGPRYVADADVSIPRPPGAASLRLGVSLAPILLKPDLQCGPPDRAGIRPATLLVTGPSGYPLEVGPAELDVHACNPDFGRPRGIRVPLTVAVGAALLSALAAALLSN